MRKFDKYTYKDKVFMLSSSLMLALRENDGEHRKWKTDVYGIAAQYGRIYGIKRSDFELIKGLTMDEICKILVEPNED